MPKPKVREYDDDIDFEDEVYDAEYTEYEQEQQDYGYDEYDEDDDGYDDAVDEFQSAPHKRPRKQSGSAGGGTASAEARGASAAFTGSRLHG